MTTCVVNTLLDQQPEWSQWFRWVKVRIKFRCFCFWDMKLFFFRFKTCHCVLKR